MRLTMVTFATGIGAPVLRSRTRSERLAGGMILSRIVRGTFGPDDTFVITPEEGMYPDAEAVTRYCPSGSESAAVPRSSVRLVWAYEPNARAIVVVAVTVAPAMGRLSLARRTITARTPSGSDWRTRVATAEPVNGMDRYSVEEKNSGAVPVRGTRPKAVVVPARVPSDAVKPSRLPLRYTGTKARGRRLLPPPRRPSMVTNTTGS